MNDPLTDQRLLINRRHFFGKTATGVGAAALASLLDRSGLRAEMPVRTPTHPSLGLPDIPHFAPKAKFVRDYSAGTRSQWNGYIRYSQRAFTT